MHFTARLTCCLTLSFTAGCSGPAGVGQGDVLRTTPAILQAGCRIDAAAADQLPAITVLGSDCPRLLIIAPSDWRYGGILTLNGVEAIDVTGDATIGALSLQGPAGKNLTINGNFGVDGEADIVLTAPLVIASGRVSLRGQGEHTVHVQGGGIIVDGGTLALKSAALVDCGIAIPRGQVQMGHIAITSSAAPASRADDGRAAAVTVGRAAQLVVDGPVTMTALPGGGIAAQAGGDTSTTQVSVSAPIEFPDQQAGEEPLYIPDHYRSRRAVQIVSNQWLQDGLLVATKSLLGQFVGSCTLVPDGQGGGTSLRETFELKANLEDTDPQPDVVVWYWHNPRFVHTIDQFSDRDCQVIDRTTKRAGPFYLYADVNAITGVTGLTNMIDFDYQVEEWIPRTTATVTGFNNGTVCGYGDWQANQPKPVQGRVCFKNGDYELKIKLKLALDLFRLAGEVLTLGPAPEARHPDYRDFRPTDLDEKRRFKRVLVPQAGSSGTPR